MSDKNTTSVHGSDTAISLYKYAPFGFSPPLLNSATPWATDASDLLSLYSSPHTGAVSIRTSLVSGFKQNSKDHQYTFFSSTVGQGTSKIKLSEQEGRGEVKEGETSSLNTFGYSPIPFVEYIELLRKIRDSGILNEKTPFPDKKPRAKPFIVSVTGTPNNICFQCMELLKLQNELASIKSREDGGGLHVMMEINLSCPNIPDKPPAAYDSNILSEYLASVATAKDSFAISTNNQVKFGVHVGFKTPPYTYSTQFDSLIEALERGGGNKHPFPISFLTATNTLGSCLLLNDRNEPSLGSANGLGIGGMAGDALHQLALGNVKTLRSMLDASEYRSVREVQIIGVGGVKDKSGFERMRSVGAVAVGVGTAYGREGLRVFGKILNDEYSVKCKMAESGTYTSR